MLAGYNKIPFMVFNNILLVLILTTTLVIGVLHPPGSHPTTICDLPYCTCDPNVKCRCTDSMQKIILRSIGYDHLPEGIGSITIEQCSKVLVTKDAIFRIKALRRINIENIGLLELEEESFKWDTTRIQEVYNYPGIDIYIVNTTIPLIPTDSYQGHINSIIFDNVTITTIRSLAFSNLAGIEKIEFKNCYIDSIEPHSFKKFILDTFIINGGYIEIMPSYSIIGITIKKDLIFENVEFGYIRSSAFRVDGPKRFKLQNCKILNLEGDAFRIIMRGSVIIDDNLLNSLSYGSFAGITLEGRFQKWSGKQDLIFENNTINQFEDYSLLLNTTGFIPKIDRIVIDKECSCKEIKIWTEQLVKYTDGSKPVDVSRLMWCTRSKTNIITDSVVSDFQRRHCTAVVSQVYWVISVLIITLIVLLLLCSLGFWLFRRHARRYMNVPTNDHAQNRLSVHSTHSNHVIIIPEGKTYRETELHIIEERVEPIKEYVPPQQAVTQPI